ncbi:MAG TPA: glycogen debranching N-terminal domain-containing protein, partial [Dehalococcoidia bacterium]
MTGTNRRTPIVADPEQLQDDPAFALPEGEPMGIEDIRDALVIRERSIFLLTDPLGNAPAGNVQGFGIYRADTRHLSSYDLTLNGTRPVMLLSTAELGYAMEQVMTNPTLHQGDERDVTRGTIELRRQRVVADVVEETLTLSNFNRFPVSLQLLYRFSADFADIFDVRGYQREHIGKTHAPELSERAIVYRYTGVDGRERSTRIDFDQAPDYVDESSV